MSCGCKQDPCSCAPPVRATKCDLYRPGDKNVWVERGDTYGSENAPGICLLDTWSKEQVIYSLERDEVARADLVKVTTDPDLLELAQTVVRLPTAELVDMEQTTGNRPNNASSIPFYAIFRGNPPFPQ